MTPTFLHRQLCLIQMSCQVIDHIIKWILSDQALVSNPNLSNIADLHQLFKPRETIQEEPLSEVLIVTTKSICNVWATNTLSFFQKEDIISQAIQPRKNLSRYGASHPNLACRFWRINLVIHNYLTWIQWYWQRVMSRRLAADYNRGQLIWCPHFKLIKAILVCFKVRDIPSNSLLKYQQWYPGLERLKRRRQGQPNDINR